MFKCNEEYWDRKFGPCDPTLPECHKCIVKHLIYDCECIKIICPDRLPNGAPSCKDCEVPHPTKRPKLEIKSLRFSCARPECDKYKETSKLCEGKELCKTKIYLYKCACYTHETSYTKDCPGRACMLDRPGGPRTKPQIISTHVYGQACKACEKVGLSHMKQSREVEEHRWKEDAQRAMIYEKSDKILWTDRTRNSGNDLTAEETEYLIEEDTKRFTSRGSYEHQHEIHRQLETHSTNISNKAHKRPTLAPHEPSPQHYPRSEHRHGHEPSESRSQYSPVPMTRPASKTTVHPATPPVDSEIAQRPREQEERARQLRMRLEQDGAREAEKAYQAAAAHAKKVREDALSFHCDHWETQAIPRRSSPMKHDARKPPLKSALKAPIQRSSSRGSERASSSHHFEPDIEDESERGERRRGRPTERM